MKKLLFIFLILFSCKAISSSLPNCPSDPSVTWDNCIGTYTYAEGDKYVGEWRNGNRHGQGTYTYANGDKYVGEWEDSNKHGQGTYTYANGDKYVGEWKNGKRQGLTRKDEIEIFVILFLLIFFGLCLNQFFGINILSVTQSIILYPFKQLALSIRYFFSLTLVKIFIKTLLILISLFLIYLIYLNSDAILVWLIILSPILFLVWLSIWFTDT